MYLQEVCRQVHKIPNAQPSPGPILNDSAGLNVEERRHAQKGSCFHCYSENAPLGTHKLSQAQRVILILKRRYYSSDKQEPPGGGK